MYDTIRERFDASGYDFRAFTHPEDPFRASFESKAPYYRMKWAAASALSPRSILEFGVERGYCMRAFLDAAPQTSYLGVIRTGPAASEWAAKLGEGFAVRFTAGDPEPVLEPVYDLVHLNRQPDRDVFFQDAQTALRHGRYILIDGYFQSEAVFEATHVLLRQYKALVEFYTVIPSCTGDLLIKTSDGARRAYARVRNPSSSQEIQETYTADYYLTDCGGNDAYRRKGGKSLEDPRLRVMGALAELRPGGTFLDLGCGRGEMAYAFAAKGASGTAIDYSPDAIELSERCFAGEPERRSRVKLICGDAITSPWPDRPELATAADLVEHLTATELERLYARLSRSLSPTGLFIVHTYPNLWFYKYGYPKRRKAAMASGAFISPEPRSLFEQLMHINEQSPRVLRDQLKRHFAHVRVWAGSPEDPVGSLSGKKPVSYYAATSDLFAVASNTPIEKEAIEASLSMTALPLPEKGSVGIEVIDAPPSVTASASFSIKARFKNDTGHRLSSWPPHPVRLAYHWEAANGDLAVYEGRRTPFFTSVFPQTSVEVEVQIDAPAQPGDYRLQLTVVQEGMAWWDSFFTGCGNKLPLKVV